MELSLILVPYHLGDERIGMGLGPERILQAGIHRQLSAQGHDVTIETTLRQRIVREAEIVAIVEINRLLAKQVRSALEQERFPIVVAGNCNTCIGTLAGIATRPIGIVWLDAHGDFNTPETSASGFLDGMSLAMATGLCCKTLWTSVGGLPVCAAHVVHIGGRDFDRRERECLAEQQIRVVPAAQLRQPGLAPALRPTLAALRSQVHCVYLHVDLDVLDPAEARANDFAAPNGLSLPDLDCAIRMVGETFDIKAAALTAYDPAYDKDDCALGASLRLIHTIVEAVAQRRRR